MPMRYITIPSAISLVDPATRDVLRDANDKPVLWTFVQLVQRLMANPMWVESLTAMRAQQAIADAIESIQGGVLALAEEDWLKLKAAAETPRMQVDTPSGPQAMIGLGLHPTLARQLLPLLLPIIDARTSSAET